MKEVLLILSVAIMYDNALVISNIAPWEIIVCGEQQD